MKRFLMRLFSTLIIMSLLVYASCIIINQEKELRGLEKEKEKYASLIDEASLRAEELENIRDKVNSDEYIEQYAREKLGLVMPYETIFVDASI